VSGLTDADLKALNDAHAAWVLWKDRGTWESYIAPAVEAIVTRAVNEALTEAADEIAGWEQMFRVAGNDGGPLMSVNHAAEDAYRCAARIVRRSIT
jgi:hypothetical protein